MPRKYKRKEANQVIEATKPPPTVADYDRLVREHGELQKQNDKLFEEHFELKEQYHELLEKNVPAVIQTLSATLQSVTLLASGLTDFNQGHKMGYQEGFVKGIHRIVAVAEQKMCEEFKCAPAALGSKKPAWWIAALMVTNPTIPDPESKKPRADGIKMSSLARGQHED